MDFEDAAVRLARDQTRARNRSAASSGRRGLGEKAKRQAEYQKRQQEKLRKERERKKRIGQYQQKYMTSGAWALRERPLGPKNMTANTAVTTPTTTITTTTTTTTLTKNQVRKHRGPLVLQPTSIWGDGDKIALPPSVLETLTAMTLNTSNGVDDDDDYDGGSGSGPWTFRVGIPNPDYKFPMSTSVKELLPPEEKGGHTIGTATGVGKSNDLAVDEDGSGNGNGTVVAMDEDSDDEEDDDDDDDDNGNTWDAYLDELDHKYLSYTHCTVVEFTQEEGFCGIPQPIAEALLDPANSNKRKMGSEGGPGQDEKGSEGTEPRSNTGFVIRPTRTIDPASASMKRSAEAKTEDGVGIDGEPEDGQQQDDTAMDITTNTAVATSDDDGDKTPGHLAWGAFDIPDVPGLEITLVKLPKGKGATLVPTPEAVRRNFYGLKDVKLVLEQSLIRTRATLSLGDVVSTWHRGVRFDLKVTKLIPASFGAVLCINTDIEVDIGETKVEDDDDNKNSTSTTKPPAAEDEPKGFRLGSGGQTLSSPPSAAAAAAASSTESESKRQIIDLPAEPPVDQKEAVCTVQIRHSSGQGKRRFNINTARVKDLFGFASSLMDNRDVTTFRLVTRFPRREFSLQDDDGGGLDGPIGQSTFADAGIQQGQELFLCENI